MYLGVKSDRLSARFFTGIQDDVDYQENSVNGGTSVHRDTMPKKKTYNFGHPKNKKNKPKRDEGEEAEVKDKEDHDEGSSSSDAAASGESDVEPVKSAAASRNEPLQVGETGAKFKQVEIPGKGQGLVATARLPVGTIVVQESPIFTANENQCHFTHGSSIYLAHDVEEIVAKFRRLTEEQKNQVLSLYDPTDISRSGRMLSAWATKFTKDDYFESCRESKYTQYELYGTPWIVN